MAKRARERARQQKQEAKREKQLARAAEAEASTEPPIDEERLMNEYARLSESYDANRMTEADYAEHRRRIFTELGLETD